MRQRVTTAILAVLAVGCLASCGGGAYEGEILGTLERDRLELIAEGNEPIVEIAVREGDAVEPGKMLLRQELGVMQARLDQATAAKSVAERRLAELVKGPRAQEIAEARANLEAAQSARETEENEYRRVQDLVTRELVSQSALDQARSRRDSAAGTAKQATARLQLLLEGTRIEEVEQAEAAVKQAHAAVLELQTSAERYVVKAPRAGRIEAIPFKLGERPSAGAAVVVMLAEGTPYARVYVPEPLRTQFKPGTRVRATIDGREEALDAVVRFVSAEAAFTPYYALTQEDRSRLSYLAEVDVTDPAAADLPTGVPVQIALVDESQ